MTTAVSSKPATAPAQQPAKILFQGLVAIDKIDVGDNFRKNFDDVEMQQLTASVKANGVDTPILLRPHGARYHLVAGARRLRASVANKLTHIPAIVKDLNDNQALVSHAIENLQRKGLAPIEEARGLKLMIDKNKSTHQELAALIDKSVSYVIRSVRLLELPKEAIEAIDDGRLTPAHGHQILRMPEGSWKSLTLEVIRDGNTAADIKVWIDRSVGGDLTHAKFPKDKPYAGAVACSGCPFNSANQGTLFDEAEKGRCTNGKCFSMKTDAVRAEFIAKVKAKHPLALKVEVDEKNHYRGTGATAEGGWVCLGELKGIPKGKYWLSINPDDRIHVWGLNREQKKQAHSSSIRPKPKKVDPKVEFIDEHIKPLIAKALADKSAELTIKHVAWIAAEELEMCDDKELVEKALGFKIKHDEKSLIALGEKRLNQIIVLAKALTYDGDVNPNHAKTIGFDLAKATASAKVLAEKAWSETWGRKHLSVANSGSETACGIKTLNYKTATEHGIAVPMDKDVTCPDCKKSSYMKR